MSKKLTFDRAALAKAILAKRTKDDLSFGQIQDSHGIGKSKLHAMEDQAHSPNSDTLAIVCDWLDVNPGIFFKR